MEIWTPLREFPNYVINSEGILKQVDTGSIKTNRVNNYGDLIVNLYREGRPYTRKVSLLVAQSYLGEPRNEAFNSVIHLNGDKTDCNAINLAWRPRWFVVAYNQMFENNPINVSVRIKQTGEIFGTLREACVKYGMVESAAYLCAQDGSSVFPTKYILEIL
ncbi:HNH endonuclease [Gordonia phage Avazak]|uniref:HNH endonuclease n=1 Tax=Gordonia phage Avazak TaxID=2656529 RepID=A0A649V7U1_9CAUD|nr:HNH endonuclease [Gordonia phage Avazak]QGJ88065.1 HNH endonuclease [Gordonia phage Avazak]